MTDQATPDEGTVQAGAAYTVLKLDLDGLVNWQYPARLLSRGPRQVVLEAYFDRQDLPFLDLVLKHGDRFVETYFEDRCYNVFEIFDRHSLQRKGWYCNLSRPARITDSQVAWVDLALDLWVWPDGRRTVLDRDDFAALAIGPEERAKVEQTLLELERAFQVQKLPPLR